MTLNELIEELTDLREREGAQTGDMEVMMTADYGDRSRTLQALEIRRVEQRDLYNSAYSNSGLAVIDPRGEDEETVAQSAVVLL